MQELKNRFETENMCVFFKPLNLYYIHFGYESE